VVLFDLLSMDLCAVTVAVMRPTPWCTAAAHSITYTHMVCSEDYRWVKSKTETKSYIYTFNSAHITHYILRIT